MNTFLFLQRTAISSELSGMFNNSSENFLKASLQGSFQHDIASGKFNMQWLSMYDFEIWMQNEQKSKSIELKLHDSYPSKQNSFLLRQRFVCGRNGTGGTKIYERKHPEWKRKIGKKVVGCPCSLIVKTYPDTTCVLGKYTDEHTHMLGQANLKFTHLSTAVRAQIAELLRRGVEAQHIVSGRIIPTYYY